MEKYDAIIRQYRMIYDHHTHTIYSHGKGTILDNVRAAAAKGIRSIAITDHGPGHLTYGIKMEQLPQMRKDIRCQGRISGDGDPAGGRGEYDACSALSGCGAGTAPAV